MLLRTLAAVLLIVGCSAGIARGQTARVAPADRVSTPPALAAELNVAGEASISRVEPLVLTFNRLPVPDEGRLAVVLGTIDLTALFVRTGPRWRYTPDLLPLPSGAQELVVYLVGPDDRWQEVTRWPVQVRLPGGFEKAQFDPSVTVSNEGQVAQGQVPVPEEPLDRATYQDLSGQVNGQLTLERPGWAMQVQANVVGVSYENEALRFGTLQEDAPRIDLSSYLVQVQRGSTALRLGHVNHGRHPFLVSSFGSRGATVETATASGRLDLSLAAMNGTSVVGWANPVGLNEPDHRILSATAGIELLEERPGGFRIEVSMLDGAVLPRGSFNQGAVLDAERSRGGGLRVIAGSRTQRFRFEGGMAGSRFTNPSDPGLAQGHTLVAVRDETRFAHFADLTVGLLQNVQLSPSWPLNASVNLRRERIDPLYRSVAAFIQPDVLQHTASGQVRLGGIQVQASHSRAEDNLDDVASILTTFTRQTSVNASVPLGAALAPSSPPPLLPSLSYRFGRTHQFGGDLPEDGGFSASHVPDQLSTQHAAGADWYGDGWRLGLQWSRADQDNRQEGREDADFVNVTHTARMGVTPSPVIDLNFDVGLDRAESLAEERIDRTVRVGLQITVRPAPSFTLSGSLAPTRTQDDDRQSLRMSNNVSLEGAWAFPLGGAQQALARGRVFVRFAQQVSEFTDVTFQIDDERRTWTVNTGVSLNLF